MPRHGRNLRPVGKETLSYLVGHLAELRFFSSKFQIRPANRWASSRVTAEVERKGKAVPEKKKRTQNSPSKEKKEKTVAPFSHRHSVVCPPRKSCSVFPRAWPDGAIRRKKPSLAGPSASLRKE